MQLNFLFCFPKAGSKACAVTVFVSVSAPHPQQWLLKFGRGYVSERYTHFCTFQDCKRARQFSRQLRETRQVPTGFPQLPTAHAPCSLRAAEQRECLGMGETSALWNTRASLGTRVFRCKAWSYRKRGWGIWCLSGWSPHPTPLSQPWFCDRSFECPKAMGYCRLEVKCMWEFYQHQKRVGSCLWKTITFWRILKIIVDLFIFHKV